MMKETCSICYENDEETNFELGCGHSYHRICLLRWSSAKFTHGEVNCPVCRTPFETKILYYDEERVKCVKEMNTMCLSTIVALAKENPKGFNITNKETLEEIEVFAPMIYTYITDPEKFFSIVDILTRVNIQKDRFKTELDIEKCGKQKRTLPWSEEGLQRQRQRALERGEVDIGDGIPRRILERRNL